MKCLIHNIKMFILTNIIFLVTHSLTNAQEIYESFSINSDFKEIAFVTNYNEYVSGVIQIISTNKIFGKYNSIKLYKFSENDFNESLWLEERLENEIKYIGDVERLLRSEDSPLNDTVFEYAKSSLPNIDDTIKKAAFEPMWFCEHIKQGYNKEGKYLQLSCLFPLGMFKYYMTLRLQKIGKIHYYKLITALNNKRFKNIIDIADSFELK